MIDWVKTKNVFGDVDLSSYRPKVCVKCDECGKESILTIRVKKKIIDNNINWLCHKCVGNKNSKILSDRSKELWSNEEYRDKISSNSKKLWQDKNYITKIRSNRESFINESNIIHNFKYDYTKVDYINSNTNVLIICPIHGAFNQLPLNHLSGHGCPKCVDTRLTTKDFVKQSVAIHGCKYDYSKVNYINSKTKVKIICPVHGEFTQLPISHYSGHGCPKCCNLVSKGHKEIADFIKIDKIINDRNTIAPYELDIYMPKKKLAIEYNGLYYHSYNYLESKEEKSKHSFKADLCEQNNIQLIQIFEDEWVNKQRIVKSVLNSKIGHNKRIYARNCYIVEMCSQEFNEFCDSNHLQGHINTKVRLGLKYDNKNVCVIGFNKKGKVYECTRFCNVIDYNIIGGASKLLKYFIGKYNPKNIVTFADRRYSNGQLYKALGFTLIGKSDPGYFYVKNGNRYPRTKFQKCRLSKLLSNYNQNYSEALNMFNNGFRRIWDAGHLKFEYII